jgi:hypothetical protein
VYLINYYVYSHISLCPHLIVNSDRFKPNSVLQPSAHCDTLFRFALMLFVSTSVGLLHYLRTIWVLLRINNVKKWFHHQKYRLRFNILQVLCSRNLKKFFFPFGKYIEVEKRLRKMRLELFSDVNIVAQFLKKAVC